MPRKRITVTPKTQNPALPVWASEYVFMVQEMERRDVLSEFSRRFQVQRRDGYSSLDVLLFLLSYFCSGEKIGLRPFSRKCSRYGRQLAAVGGRRRWPGQSSVSRFLSSVTDEQIDEIETWLLNEAVNAAVVEDHWSALCRDTHGEQWHVFDYDPTVTTLRARALPTGEDLPEPHRRSSEMAAAGYPGRKRGDVQFSRATLQHAGTGQWIGISMGPGNGRHRRDFGRALHQVGEWCERTTVESSRAIMRSDGAAGGGIPAMTACKEADVRYVTRLSRYELLEQAPIRKRLQEATWYDVEDSLSGPKRQAAELGEVRLNPGQRVRRDNGEPYEEISVRVIITRIPIAAGERKRGVGIAGDGWWYELFGTNLCASAWPAPETVTLYYGRIGQENRFYQEDRELGLDRIFSYNLPGQRLANLIGLFVWNMRIARGAELFEPLPKKILPQEVRSVIAHIPENSETSVCESEDLPPKAMDEGPDLATLLESTEEESERTPETFASVKNRGRTAAQLFQNGYGPLGALNWSEYLSRLDGWTWDETMGILCPNHAPLRPHEILVGEDGSIFMRWRSRAASCRECPIRAQCTESKSPIFRREVCFTLEKSETQNVIEYLARIESVQVDKPEPAQESAPDIPHWRPTVDENNPGKLCVSAPMLIPSELRQKFRAECAETQVEVRLTDEQKYQKKTYVFLATTPEERQQRRKTWAWRMKHNELPANAHVEVVLRGGAKLAELLNRKTEASNAA